MKQKIHTGREEKSMFMSIIIVLCAILILPSILTAFQDEDPDLKDPNIWVSVMVYSGRPDPGWRITEMGEFEFLRRGLKDLPTADEPQWPVLGWRGFMLINDRVPELPMIFRVFKGVIKIEKEGRPFYYRDVHCIEQWLNEQAEKRGLDDDIEAMSTDRKVE